VKLYFTLVHDAPPLDVDEHILHRQNAGTDGWHRRSTACGAAGECSEARRGALDVAPVAIALNTDQEISALIVVADLPAGQEAIQAVRGQRQRSCGAEPARLILLSEVAQPAPPLMPM